MEEKMFLLLAQIQLFPLLHLLAETEGAVSGFTKLNFYLLMINRKN